jgi:GTPase Era involved in 16S rRNA processing
MMLENNENYLNSKKKEAFKHMVNSLSSSAELFEKAFEQIFDLEETVEEMSEKQNHHNIKINNLFDAKEDQDKINEINDQKFAKIERFSIPQKTKNELKKERRKRRDYLRENGYYNGTDCTTSQKMLCDITKAIKKEFELKYIDEVPMKLYDEVLEFTRNYVPNTQREDYGNVTSLF